MLLDGYVRVSLVAGRSGDSFISPSVQRRQIVQWVALRGVTLGEIFEELDESGGRRDRPQLQQALARVEAGDSGGIIVAKLDRFGRSLVDGLAGIERITKAGGTFVSVQDGLDLSTDTGKLVLRILLSMAEHELDRCRTNWAVAQSRAIARGVSMGGTPFGYHRLASGRLAPDRRMAPIIAELFGRRAAGASIAELRHWLNGEGVSAPRGGPNWTGSTVASLLKNPTYLGRVRHGEFVNDEAHQPLVDRATWQQAQRPLQKYQVPAARPPALLKGLLRCVGCQRPMSAVTKRRGTDPVRRVYSCPTTDSSGGRCPVRAAVTDTVAEPFVEALFWQELDGPSARAVRNRVAEAEGVHRQAEEALVRYRDNDRLAEILGAERFASGVRVRLQRSEAALLELHRARRVRDGPDLPPAEELRVKWAGMNLAERRAAFAEVFECVFVAKGRGHPEQRLFAFRRGSAPASLQSAERPQRLAGPVPFDPAEQRGYLRLRKEHLRPVGERELRHRLQVFLTTRDYWPRYPEFRDAGEGLLYWQVQRLGGNRRWALAFERVWTGPEKYRTLWPDTKIEAALGPFLDGRSVWPDQEEFRVAGLSAARNAVAEAGGAERWAEHFELELPLKRRTNRRRWTDEAIELELHTLTAGRETWPPRRDFDAAGLHPLYQVLLRRGKPERQRWAKRLKVRLPDRQRLTGPYRWPDQAIREQLGPLIDGKDWFPTKAEFDRGGATRLYNVLRQSDKGLDGWAREVALPRRRGGRLPA